MDKLHRKKQVASKKKKQTSENKIRPVKKMRGGDKKFDLRNKSELQEFKKFVEEKFILLNNSQN